MEKCLLFAVIAWAVYEHDRRVRLEAFSRLALPLVVNEMQRRGMPINPCVENCAGKYAKAWDAIGSPQDIAANVFDLYAM